MFTLAQVGTEIHDAPMIVLLVDVFRASVATEDRCSPSRTQPLLHCWASQNLRATRTTP
jgi:hypothetical protein